MLKIAGILLIVAAGAGIGFSKSFELTKRERALETILRMVILLKGEIRYGNASLHDAFCGAASKLSGEYACFLEAVAERMEAKTGESFGRLFRECAGEYLSELEFDAQQREKLFSLGENLGYLDLAMQIKQLDLYEKELEYSIEELRRELPAQKKAYQSLGILGGVLLAILVC